jgi:hypothetical protein
MRPPNSQLQKLEGGKSRSCPIFPFENFEKGKSGGHSIVTLKTHKGNITWPFNFPFQRVSKGENRELTQCSLPKLKGENWVVIRFSTSKIQMGNILWQPNFPPPKQL